MARVGPSNEVVARWAGGMKAVVRVGGFSFVVDEPESAGGTDEGPMPTDYLLGSLASCFTLALAWAAQKRGVEIGDLEVIAQGDYDGPRFASLTVAVRCALPDAVLDPLMESANRVCYVSRTIATSPPITVRRA